jgi:3,4-dihydroxy-2-butanone 4-phosphate synthase
MSLAEAAGLVPAAAICRILAVDGRPVGGDELLLFAAQHDMLVGTVAELARSYQPSTET